jgi:hypothetical protein
MTLAICGIFGGTLGVTAGIAIGDEYSSSRSERIR